MQDTDHDRPAGCGGKCSRCDLGREVPGAPRGWRLVLGAAGMFVVPLALAIAGTIVAGQGSARQAVGAAAGLLAGVIAAILTGRFFAGRSADGQRRDAQADKENA